ncbi:MAG: putative zinc ribbon domain protein [candidate division TA06 bacterium ADurb.Bin417]|uniref:Putative zinc ribbon domain protein n=1 Tax=candidate division TA06 bacterium ADurb.Bin417 TaxID=1852828 RepID=A0A1V5MKF1_UNCT6|nr:MAG: putative zinc ribbon domain protein [candidate division TA06 bacterium ADurb.Bin417]
MLNKKADHKALAAVKAGVCKGCQMRLPTVTIDQLHKGTDLIICENCSRILYLED